MAGKPDLSNYVEVNERILKFKEKHPEGSLQGTYSYQTIDDKDLIVFVAKAYREPSDMRPGVGHASEPIPGQTQFTKGSELMNAETSAWGRALAALGFEVKRGIASREEVQNRSESNGDAKKAKPKKSKKVTDDRAVELVQRAEDIYSEIVKVAGRSEMPRKEFDGYLKTAQESHKRLEDFGTWLEEQLEAKTKEAA